ncbi:hypothetical protein ACSBQ5_13585 [Staphylococcus equorum]|uniref:hypothetical protein n=1 Tax=Staphylococcus equorum TaxID=246432 RepID=UPI001F5416B9|nr:hypothetical protein [Staphylococcus equorum]
MQQIIKLTWWEDKKYTDKVIANVIGITEYTLRHAREVILKCVAKAVEYYMRYDKVTVKAFILN